MTISGVSSALATPRIPSVPNRAATGSALRVLRRLASLLQAVLLAFLLAGVPGEQPGPLEARTQFGVDLHQRAGDAETERAGLTRGPPAVHRHVDVVTLGDVRDAKGL